MSAELTQILHLQELDAAIDLLQNQIKERESHLHQCREDAQTRERSLEALRAQLTTQEAEHAEFDRTLKLEQERLRKSRRKVNDLKKDYEIRAMQREIESTRRSNEELEEKILQVWEQIDQLKKKIEEEDADLAKVQGSVRESEGQLTQTQSNLDADLQARFAEREKLVGEMDRQLLSRYQRIRERLHADALVRVENYICQGCFMNVPPQSVNEMLREQKIMFCPNCQRLVYVPPPES